MQFLQRNSQAPIGIFDSGIGGLTVAHAIAGLLPDEQLVYYGDTARMPYGNKSTGLVSQYADSITRFLLNDIHCKAVVIACNTASAAAYTMLRDRYEGHIPVINVIDPMVEAVISDSSINKVGIIATQTTINSGVYQEKFSRRKPTLQYAVVAAPLLAVIIEEEFHNKSAITSALHQYLSHPGFEHIDALVLACTHYPLIKNEISAFFQHKVKIFDSAQQVARRLKEILKIENLLSQLRTSDDIFYVSDLTTSFEKSTRLFFGKEVKLKLKVIG
ncbi:MAG: glutamate racemase [Bacteroidia bacterium]|nr:glutamate racemase [Bacteroidia bacterium]MCZ2278134.1 glutamate racemase [Bacteroidia bacterium]